MADDPRSFEPRTVDEAIRFLSYRVGKVENDLEDQEDIPGRVKAIEDNMTRLDGAITKLTWSIVGFALTVAASAAAVVIAGGHP